MLERGAMRVAISTREMRNEQHEAAVANGCSTPYDPARPWSYVWGKLPDAEQFWRRELHEPAMLVLNKIDLVPPQNARMWQKYLRTEFPCILFKAN